MKDRASSAKRTSLARRLHRRLRGRYALALLAVLLGAGAGGVLGWRSTEPQYRATGSLYVNPRSSDLRGASDPTRPSPLETFIASQVEMIGTGEVARRAVETDVWQGAGGRRDETALRAFDQGRSVARVPGTHVIRLAFVSTDPDLAVAGVHALVEAYQAQLAELHGDDQDPDDSTKEEKSLVRRLRQGIEALRTMTAEYGGPEGLEIHHRASVHQVIATEDAIRALRREIVRAESGSDAGLEPRPLTPHEIAILSRSMAEHLAQVAVAEAREKVLSTRAGSDPLKVLALRDRVGVLQKGVDDLAEAWNRKRDASGVTAPSVEELRARETGLDDRLESLRERSTTLGRLHGEAKKLREENDELDRQLIQLEALDEHLAAQPGGRGRVQVADPGMRPTAPYHDERALRAAIGAAGGGLLAFLLVLLLSMRDRRLRNAVAADDVLHRVRSLGLLPALSSDPSNVEAGRVATHFAHQIRTLLEIAHARDGCTCLCVTGPRAGSGKTTLTAALGLSFASTGSRTLLVDTDPGDRGLMRTVIRMLECHVTGVGPGEDAAVPEGHLLEPLVHGPEDAASLPPDQLETLLTEAVARVGLRRARETGLVRDLFSLADLLDADEARDRLALQLMKSLASEGELTSGSPAEWIPARTKDVEHPGALLDEVLLEQHLYRTGSDTLRFLPLFGIGRDAGSSIAMMAGVLSCLRASFDVVLVDAGPVPGTDETSLVAAQADSVVVVVSPEDQGPQAERSLAYLTEIGARIAGVVFNRAAEKDIVATGRTMYVSRDGMRTR